MEGNKSSQEMQGLCKEGCGFYGSSTNEGFCSQCFKKRLRRWLHHNEPSTTTTATLAAPTTTETTLPNVQDTTTTTSSIPSSASSPTTTTPIILSSASSPPSTTAHIIVPSTPRVISSSVDREEFGGDDSDDDGLVCNTDNKDKHKKQVEKEGSTCNKEGKGQDGGDDDDDAELSDDNSTAVDAVVVEEEASSGTIEDFKNSSLTQNNKDAPCEEPSTPEEERGGEAEATPVLTTVVEDLEGEKAGKKKNRCHVCAKKVGLTGFGCRCGDVFCGVHRYSDTHKCPFDYKSLGKHEIEKNNPKVAFEKVAKI